MVIIQLISRLIGHCLEKITDLMPDLKRVAYIPFYFRSLDYPSPVSVIIIYMREGFFLENTIVGREEMALRLLFH